MTKADRPRSRRALSAAHESLGTLLRQARVTANASTRDLGYSSGHVSNVEGGHVTPSRELVEAYIGLGADRGAIEPLFEQIQAESRLARESRRRVQRVQSHRSLGGPPQRVDGSTQGRDVRSHYTVESYDAEFEFSETGSIQCVTSSVEIRAVTEGVRYYFAGHAPDESHQRRAMPQGQALSGGELERVNTSPVGAMDMFFFLDRELNPTDVEPHRISYEVQFEPGQLADPSILYVTRPGVRRHRLAASFRRPAVPTALWSVAAPDTYTADRPEPAAQLTTVEPWRYEFSFDPIVAGWCYGFTWLWPDALTAADPLR